MSSSLFINDTPAEVKNAKGLHLLTQNTANGQKVQILLEELADVYGTQWTTTFLSVFAETEHKKEWYLRLNPNGRIPVIVDNTKSPPIAVFETPAELFYLLDFADKDNKFGFLDKVEQSECLQWLFFWHGGGSPYQGNLGFFNFAAEKSPLAIDRFRKETLRAFGVLEIRLSGIYANDSRDYLGGSGRGKYSIADIAAWTWVKYWPRGNFTQEEMDAFPHLLQWLNRIAQRPAVKRGIGEKYGSY